MDCGVGLESVTTGDVVNGNANNRDYTIEYICKKDNRVSPTLASREVNVRTFYLTKQSACGDNAEFRPDFEQLTRDEVLELDTFGTRWLEKCDEADFTYSPE